MIGSFQRILQLVILVSHLLEGTNIINYITKNIQTFPSFSVSFVFSFSQKGSKFINSKVKVKNNE